MWHSISLLPFSWLKDLHTKQVQSFRPSRFRSTSRSSAEELDPDWTDLEPVDPFS